MGVVSTVHASRTTRTAREQGVVTLLFQAYNRGMRSRSNLCRTQPVAPLMHVGRSQEAQSACRPAPDRFPQVSHQPTIVGRMPVLEHLMPPCCCCCIQSVVLPLGHIRPTPSCRLPMPLLQHLCHPWAHCCSNVPLHACNSSPWAHRPPAILPTTDNLCYSTLPSSIPAARSCCCMY